MTAAPPPAFPEAALRAVLAGTVAAWARGVGTLTDAPSAEDEPRRFYLDAFAGAEFQFGTGVGRGGDDETRAAAAFRALEAAALAPPPNAVFAEEDPAHLGRIYAELEEAAGGERLRATRDLSSLATGEISLLEAPFAAVADDVARYAAGARTFAFLAPAAARALPWTALRPIVSRPDATVLIRLPHSDWEKQARHTSPLADLPGFARRIVEGCSAMLDDAKHNWLAAWRADASSNGQAAAMAGVVERFRALLDGAAAGRTVKPIELEAADGARAWLFLLTPDPAVALAANAAVRAAGLTDHAAAASPIPAPAPAAEATTVASASTTPSAPPPATADEPSAPSGEPSAPATPSPEPDAKPARRKGRKAAAQPAAPAAEAVEPPGMVDEEPAAPSTSAEAEAADRRLKPQQQPREASQTARGSGRPAPVAEVLDLFGEQPKPDEPSFLARPDPAELAASLEARFAGSTIAWCDILHAFAATDATPAELKAALAHLRRAGRASYKALKADADQVDFPADPIIREKPRRQRKIVDDGGLFGAAGDTDDAEGGREG